MLISSLPIFNKYTVPGQYFDTTNIYISKIARTIPAIFRSEILSAWITSGLCSMSGMETVSQGGSIISNIEKNRDGSKNLIVYKNNDLSYHFKKSNKNHPYIGHVVAFLKLKSDSIKHAYTIPSKKFPNINTVAKVALGLLSIATFGVLSPTTDFIYHPKEKIKLFKEDPKGRGLTLEAKSYKSIGKKRIGIRGVLSHCKKHHFIEQLKNHKKQFMWGSIKVIIGIAITILKIPIVIATEGIRVMVSLPLSAIILGIAITTSIGLITVDFFRKLNNIKTLPENCPAAE